MSKRKYPHAMAYGWIIDHGGRWEQCFWAEPSEEQLNERGKPSPEARTIVVRLVPEAEYRRMIAEAAKLEE